MHPEDVVGALLHRLDDERARGPVDVTARAPVTGQRVIPRRLQAPGYGFRRRAPEPALRSVLGQ